ncbi:hypothetical protein Ancab_027658 [Ancistrocladus abbreviatus]
MQQFPLELLTLFSIVKVPARNKFKMDEMNHAIHKKEKAEENLAIKDPDRRWQLRRSLATGQKKTFAKMVQQEVTNSAKSIPSTSGQKLLEFTVDEPNMEWLKEGDDESSKPVSSAAIVVPNSPSESNNMAATKIWELGKVLGAVYTSEESEVMDRNKEMETKDRAAWERSNQAKLEGFDRFSCLLSTSNSTYNLTSVVQVDFMWKIIKTTLDFPLGTPATANSASKNNSLVQENPVCDRCSAAKCDCMPIFVMHMLHPQYTRKLRQSSGNAFFGSQLCTDPLSSRQHLLNQNSKKGQERPQICIPSTIDDCLNLDAQSIV